MKINFSTLSTSIFTLSIAVTGCTNNSDTQNVTIPGPKVSIDNMANDVSVNASETNKNAKFFTYPYQHGAEIASYGRYFSDERWMSAYPKW